MTAEERPGADAVRRLSTTTELCANRREVLGHVGNKWSALILTLLEEAPRRYSSLRRSCRITARMLTLTLHNLERDGLIVREPGPAEVYYALSEPGRSLCAIIRSLIDWSDQHHEHIRESRRTVAPAG
ncbi:winged helix-turn-helix transcriptional regulator [Actinoplanes sp. HUAS TT8]|uniref:winged helix-turn-helix transcriptional regulator n=1 Tax=Actinoplanes sp. HUAS TT8 TaxID=3447453 RepID=UPI003F526CA9